MLVVFGAGAIGDCSDALRRRADDGGFAQIFSIALPAAMADLNIANFGAGAGIGGTGDDRGDNRGARAFFDADPVPALIGVAPRRFQRVRVVVGQRRIEAILLLHPVVPVH